MQKLLTGGLLSCLIACSSNAVQEKNESLMTCDETDECMARGVLRVDSMYQARLDFGGPCLALALPRSFFEEMKVLDGQAVLVRGEHYIQPDHSPGRQSYRYLVEGIMVMENLCDRERSHC